MVSSGQMNVSPRICSTVSNRGGPGFSSQPSGTVSILPGWAGARTGWPDVSIQRLSETVGLICGFLVWQHAQLYGQIR